MYVIIPTIVASLFVFSAPVLAQGTQQQPNRQQGYNTQSRTPVATQPSNNPFSNPIGQGVAPAASANPNLNSGRTNVQR